MPFNPFDKPLGDALTPDDLQKLVLRGVAEGYYVEYKSIILPNEKIAKSIASLANTYGGWYIVGVKTDSHNVANDICGFDPASCPDPLAKVREVVKSHISPTPVFLAQVVTLPTGNLVLVVYVPEEQDTPFITRDARIYRRAHDSSDPVPEHDRYAVDRIIERGRKGREAFGRFCQDERTFSRGEDETGRWVSIYLWPHPYGIVEYKSGIDTEESVESLIQRSQSPTKFIFQKEDGTTLFSGDGTIPFTAGQLTHRSILLRQIAPSQVWLQTLSIELFFNGCAKIFVPLPDTTPIFHQQVTESVKSPQVRRVLTACIAQDQEYRLHNLRFFDANGLWTTIAVLINFYRDWLGQPSVLSDIKIGIELSGTWRSVPFLDVDEWAAQVEKLGMPIVGSAHITIPQNIEEGFITSYDDLLWFRTCMAVGQALGFSRRLFTHGLMKLVEEQQHKG